MITNQEKEALKVFDDLFADKGVKKFKNKIRYIEVENHRFVEQNQDKPSKYGTMARAGAKIMWVINTKSNKYEALVVDGKYSTL
jgi:hypothetical protein